MRRRRVVGAIATLCTVPTVGCLGGSRTRDTTLTLDPVDGLVSVVRDHVMSNVRTRDQQAAIQRSATTGTAFDSDLTGYVSVSGVYYRIEDVTGVTEVEGREYPATGSRWPVLTVEPVAGTDSDQSLDSYDEAVARFVRTVADDEETRRRALPPALHEHDQLVPDPAHPSVVFEGQSYRLTVDHQDVDQTVDRIRAVQVATSDDEFETHLREEALDVDSFSAGVFSSDQRDIIDKAIESDYEEDGDPSDAFESVLDVIDERGDWFGDPIGGAGSRRNRTVVAYEGTWYLATERVQITESEW